MRFFILFISLNLTIGCYSQDNNLDFGLYFGNDFKNDSVTIHINGRLIAKNIQLRNRMYDPKNLMIEQDTRNIYVRPYNGPIQKFKKIKIEGIIFKVEIEVNNLKKNFNIDLKQGKFLYAEYKFLRLGWHLYKILVITQLDFGPLII